MSYLFFFVSEKIVRLFVLLCFLDVDNNCVDLSDFELKFWLDFLDFVGVFDFWWDLLDFLVEGDFECWKDLLVFVGDFDFCWGVLNYEGDFDLL